jgi:hypothetical protein
MKREKTQKRIDEDYLIYQGGFKAGENHQKSSPETISKLTKMSDDITQLKVGQCRIETKVDNIIETLKAHINEESEYRKQQDEFHKEIVDKKANIWVEKVLIWTGTTIGLIILGALMSLIITK